MAKSFYNKSQVLKLSMLPSHSCNCKEPEIRYLLKIQLKNSYGGKKACVIMSNPSKATSDIETSDKSINNVIDAIYKQNSKINNKLYKIEFIYILNLFPFYSTQQSNLINMLKNYAQSKFEIINKNLKFIKTISCRVDYIILAWGGQSGELNYYINSIKGEFLNYIKIMNNIYVFDKPTGKQSYTLLTLDNNPRHPSRGDKISDIKGVKVNQLLSLVPIK